MRLLKDADVLVENYKPGSMEKWGLGYEDVLKKKFPKLVHCRISVLARTVPMAAFRAMTASFRR